MVERRVVLLRKHWKMLAAVAVVALAVALPISLVRSSGSTSAHSTAPDSHHRPEPVVSSQPLPRTGTRCGPTFFTAAAGATLAADYGAGSPGLCYFMTGIDGWVIQFPAGDSLCKEPAYNPSFVPPSWCPGTPPSGGGVAVETCATTGAPANCTSPAATRDLSTFSFYPAPDPRGWRSDPMRPNPYSVMVNVVANGRCGSVAFDITLRKWLVGREVESVAANAGTTLPVPPLQAPPGYTMHTGPLTPQQVAEVKDFTPSCPDTGAPSSTRTGS